LEGEEADHRQDLSVFPLAVPLIAGPGAIASTILLMSEARGDMVGQSIVLIMLVIVLFMTLLALLAASRIIYLFGVTGINVITRILGIILAALAAQYLLDGLRASSLLS
jgi:multiple antibiotic resistance protein